jgi:HPt (histidine-containing phosphotransfer) domain-containing protein
MTETREQKMAAARERLAALAAKFVQRTRAEIATMRDAVTRLSAGDAAALGEIRHLAHRMAGTGATLGFEQLSDRAMQLEKIAEAQAPHGVPEVFVLAQMAGAIEALDHELARAAQR